MVVLKEERAQLFSASLGAHDAAAWFLTFFASCVESRTAASSSSCAYTLVKYYYVYALYVI